MIEQRIVRPKGIPLIFYSLRASLMKTNQNTMESAEPRSKAVKIVAKIKDGERKNIKRLAVTRQRT